MPVYTHVRDWGNVTISLLVNRGPFANAKDVLCLRRGPITFVWKGSQASGEYTASKQRRRVGYQTFGNRAYTVIVLLLGTQRVT